MELNIINPYKAGLPNQKAMCFGTNVLLQPILERDFLKDTRLLTPDSVKKNDAKKAMAFVVLDVGPDVQDDRLKPGTILVVAEERLDFANTDGSTVVCDYSDLTVGWRQEDLRPSIQN